MKLRRRVGGVLGSIRTRLAVFFFLITAIAIAVVYVDVTPSLQSRLEQQQLKDTQRLAHSVDASYTAKILAGLQNDIATAEVDLGRAKTAVQNLQNAKFTAHLAATSHLSATQIRARLKSAQALELRREQALAALRVVAAGKLGGLAHRTGAASVTLLQFTLSANGSPRPNAILAAPAGQNLVNAATTAFTSKAAYHTAVNSKLGYVAVPIRGTNSVFVYGNTFADVASDVLLIRHRILIAAAIALAVVLLLGILVARALTVRVLRLERAAQRVAAGDLTAQFEVDANDELGQLAGALAHMQTQLRGLEEARRRFIATASHELRTPIFSLGGFLELIQDEDLDEDTRRQFVGQVREQVARLGKLATGLLDLSRLEAGSVDLQPTPTDLGVLSRAVAAEFVPALALHGSELDLDLPETPLRAVVDPDRVAQLLRILIDNAITHTPAGTPVTVAVANGDGRVRLSVADHGPGIPSQVVGRIFEPFYSADGVQGAGLGLAIARELAERLRGSLDVRSESATTVFTLTLPGEDS